MNLPFRFYTPKPHKPRHLSHTQAFIFIVKSIRMILTARLYRNKPQVVISVSGFPFNQSGLRLFSLFKAKAAE